MAPTVDEIKARLKQLRPHLQAVVVEALSSLPEVDERKVPEETWPRPGCFLEYLEQLPRAAILDIAISATYYRLSHEARALIRSRLGLTSEGMEILRSAPLPPG